MEQTFELSYIYVDSSGGVPKGMISDFRSNYFKLSARYLAKQEISVSASIPISEIRQNMNKISEFRQENRSIFVIRPLRTPISFRAFLCVIIRQMAPSDLKRIDMQSYVSDISTYSTAFQQFGISKLVRIEGAIYLMMTHTNL